MPHSLTGIKVFGRAHGLKISRFTCQLWSAVVNLILWKWVTEMCEKTKPKSSTYYMDLFIIHPTGDPTMSLLCTSANWEACVTYWHWYFLLIYSISIHLSYSSNTSMLFLEEGRHVDMLSDDTSSSPLPSFRHQGRRAYCICCCLCSILELERSQGARHRWPAYREQR